MGTALATRVRDTNPREVVVVELVPWSIGHLGSLPCTGEAESRRELGDRLFATTTSQDADGFVKHPLVLFSVDDRAFRVLGTSRRRDEKLSARSGTLGTDAPTSEHCFCTLPGP